MIRGDAEMYNGFVKFDMREERVVARVEYGSHRCLIVRGAAWYLIVRGAAWYAAALQYVGPCVIMRSVRSFRLRRICGIVSLACK